MGAQPTPTPTPAGPAAPATADAPPYGDLLDLIFDVSKDVLRHVQACTLAETGRPAPDTEADAAPRARAALDLATALDRVALAIRKTILLAERLKTAPIVAARQRTADRKCIRRHVEDAIVKQDKRPGDSEVLNAELLERLDSPDLEDEIGNRPVAEIIQEICRDLGLNGFRGYPHPYKRRTPADIEILRARAAQPAPARRDPPSPRPPPQTASPCRGPPAT